MKLLVTGANGFTGKHFCHAAKNQYDVIALKANLTNRDAVFTEIQAIQPDVIVHLAAISFVGHANVNAFYDVNVVGTTNLLDALILLPKSPEKILIASSANVYGNCEQSPISETQTPSPVNHYAISKMAMEYSVKTYLNKLPIFITRPFNYTGIRQSESFLIPKLVAHFKQRATEIELGNLHVEREFNDVRFVCDSYLRLLEKAEIGETYNVCTGNVTTLLKVIELLETITQISLSIKISPLLIRKNEVQKLCGNHDKLQKTIGELKIFSLENTLNWMLTV